MVAPIAQEAVCVWEWEGLFGLIDTVQILQSVPEDGNDHGAFCDNFIKDSSPGTDDNIIYDPQRRIYEHSGDPDLLPVMGIPADGCGDIGRHRQNGYPPRPCKNKRQGLHRTDDGTHGLAVGKFPFAPQAEGTEGIHDIADAAGDGTQQKQVRRIEQIGQTLHLEQPFVAFALVRRKKQRRSSKSDHLNEHISFPSHWVIP